MKGRSLRRATESESGGAPAFERPGPPPVVWVIALIFVALELSFALAEMGVLPAAWTGGGGDLRWAAYLEYGAAHWQALTALPGFELVEQIGFVEGLEGWQVTQPFERVYEASVGPDGLPRGCIMAVLKAV